MESLKPQKTLVEQVYERILDAICEGRLPAGSRVTQDELAAQLQVSRQPVMTRARTAAPAGLPRRTRPPRTAGRAGRPRVTSMRSTSSARCSSPGPRRSRRSAMTPQRLAQRARAGGAGQARRRGGRRARDPSGGHRLPQLHLRSERQSAGARIDATALAAPAPFDGRGPAATRASPRRSGASTQPSSRPSQGRRQEVAAGRGYRRPRARGARARGRGTRSGGPQGRVAARRSRSLRLPTMRS